jgi:putative transposase
LAISNISSSTWYDRLKDKELRASVKLRGRPKPGHTVNPDGTIVMDSTIISVLKDYRDQIEFKNSGGYQKLKHYLRRDYGFHINGKKLYRLCKEESLLLPRNKKKIKKNRKICTNKNVD